MKLSDFEILSTIQNVRKICLEYDSYDVTLDSYEYYDLRRQCQIYLNVSEYNIYEWDDKFDLSSGEDCEAYITVFKRKQSDAE